MNRNTRRLMAGVGILALTGVACGGDGDDRGAAEAPKKTTQAASTEGAGASGDDSTITIKLIAFTPTRIEIPAGGTVTWRQDDVATHTVTSGRVEQAGGTATAKPDGAATPRAGLTDLLSEHVYLAALATGAALRGDTPGFESFATALNGPTNSNTADLVAAIGSAYGPEVGKAFDGLWRSDKHIPQFVAYTQATAKGDTAGQDAAVTQLKAYAKEFGATINSVNDKLPADVVEGAIFENATELIKVINAQKAGDQTAVYQSLPDRLQPYGPHRTPHRPRPGHAPAAVAFRSPRDHLAAEARRSPRPSGSVPEHYRSWLGPLQGLQHHRSC